MAQESDGAADLVLPDDAAAVRSIDAWIAFDSDGLMANRDIYIMRPDGSRLQRLTTDPAQDVQPSFSADGRTLAFASDRSGAMQIYVLDLASSAVSLVPSRAGAQSPSFSPDGQRIAYRAGAAVYTVALDGSGERLVVAGSKCCSFTGGPFGGPVFTADGQWIIYDDYNAIYALHPDGTSEWTIVPPNTDDQSNPSLSPDGTQLALQTHCLAGPPADAIVAVPVRPVSSSPPQDASPMTPCLYGTRISPASWSFDSKHAAWGPGNAIAWDIGPSPRQIVVRKDGVIYQITRGGADSVDPAWSPGGTVIGSNATVARDAGDAGSE